MKPRKFEVKERRLEGAGAALGEARREGELSHRFSASSVPDRPGHHDARKQTFRSADDHEARLPTLMTLLTLYPTPDTDKQWQLVTTSIIFILFHSLLCSPQSAE